MRDADPLGDIARIVDVLPGAAGALAMGSRPMIVKLQRDADDVVPFGLQQRGRHRGIDAAGHGDNDPGVLRAAFKIQTVEHGPGHQCDHERQTLRDQETALRSEGFGAFSWKKRTRSIGSG
jgi:hypothetical protein